MRKFKTDAGQLINQIAAEEEDRDFTNFNISQMFRSHVTKPAGEW